MIPNIVKGRGITGAIAYGMGQGNDATTGQRKTLEAGKSSRAEILGGQNFGFEIDDEDKLDLARRMMEWNGKAENQASRGRKCDKDCLHASLSWEKGQEPTREDMTEAAKGFLRSLGMENAQAVFIAHNDTEHKHLHIIASRLDPATGKTFSQEDDFAKAQAWGLKYEREHGQTPENEARRNLHKIVDAIEAHDGRAIVANLTQRTPTFTARELDKALSYGGLSKDERAAFRGEILADKNVIGLRETPTGEVTRYTTREVLAAEMGLLRSAQKLGDDRSHGLSKTRVEATRGAFTLKPEQAHALAHLTGAEGFAVLWGEAGTGKSHTLKATRAAYEAEGAKVIGLAPTHKVKDQMREGGFQANTIDSELKGIEDGRTAWNKKTVVVVDEAAMVSTENLAKLAAAARSSGAKLIIAGDDAQLGSIERGGMFETLRQRQGAAILTEVQRVKDVEEQALWGKMHKGEFRDMLAKHDKAGRIHWSAKQTGALSDMAQRYTADSAATPKKNRFMFAFTNAEVGALNDYARGLERQRGHLGEDVTLKTAHGKTVFATGDRIQFSGNGYGKKAINAGLSNGQVGTIKEIAFEGDFLTPRLTVTLDAAKGDKPQEISFVVGEDGKAGEFNNFKHGYAGTIYRGQGRTLDQAYVCHSSQWRSSAAYVALTRHRESVEIFAARETVADLDAMARGLARPENKRAATAYHIDAAQTIDLEAAIGALELRTASRASAARTADASVGGATDRTTSRAAGVVPRGALGAAAKAVGAVFSALLGETPAAPPPMTAKQRHDARIKALLDAEDADRAARQQEIARRLGTSAAMTPEELKREQEAQEKRSRDRGGGQSL